MAHRLQSVPISNEPNPIHDTVKTKPSISRIYLDLLAEQVRQAPLDSVAREEPSDQGCQSEEFDPEGPIDHIQISGIGPEVNRAAIKRVFKQFGTITKVRIARNRRTKESLGFAFLSYADPASCLEALAMDRRDFGGSDVRVDGMRSRPSRGSLRGSRGGGFRGSRGGIGDRGGFRGSRGGSSRGGSSFRGSRGSGPPMKRGRFDSGPREDRFNGPSNGDFRSSFDSRENGRSEGPRDYGGRSSRDHYRPPARSRSPLSRDRGPPMSRDLGPPREYDRYGPSSDYRSPPSRDYGRDPLPSSRDLGPSSRDYPPREYSSLSRDYGSNDRFDKDDFLGGGRDRYDGPPPGRRDYDPLPPSRGGYSDGPPPRSSYDYSPPMSRDYEGRLPCLCAG